MGRSAISPRRRRRAVVLLLGSLVVAVGCTTPPTDSPQVAPSTDRTSVAGGTSLPRDDRGAQVAAAEIWGPLTGGLGMPAGAMPADIRDRFGYVEDEFLLEGDAVAYEPTGTWGSDGRWVATPSPVPAHYVTRLVVRRPADAARFDGTVVVEWLNVTSGQDVDVEFAHLHDELLAHGTIWVGVSAQSVGIDGGGASMGMPGMTPMPLRAADPERYAALVHPGDDYSYDLFSQAAAALRRPVGDDPLGGMRPAQVLAAGESQSAARLLTYVDAVHPLADVFDGFLIHSRSGGGAPLRIGQGGMPSAARVRDDLDVPVLQLVTESDLFGLPFIAARQPDTPRLRTWEVAGTAHLDRELVDYERAVAVGPSARGAGSIPDADPFASACGSINEGPSGPVLRAGFAALRSWAAGGAPPPSAPMLAVDGDTIGRDGLGIARGGIRTPAVDAPTSVLRGDNPSGGYVCSLFGSTVPLDAETLTGRYPSHDAYVDAVRRSADDAVRAGFLLRADADVIVASAESSPVGVATRGPAER